MIELSCSATKIWCRRFCPPTTPQIQCFSCRQTGTHLRRFDSLQTGRTLVELARSWSPHIISLSSCWYTHRLEIKWDCATVQASTLRWQFSPFQLLNGLFSHHIILVTSVVDYPRSNKALYVCSDSPRFREALYQVRRQIDIHTKTWYLVKQRANQQNTSL